MSVPPQNLEFRIGDFLLHCLVIEKSSLIADKHPILLVMVNSRVEPFNFSTHSLDSLLHFFPYNVESLSSNIASSFQPIFMFLLNIFLLE